MAELRVLGGLPPDDLFEALLAASRELGITTCYAFDGRYHFSLGAGWSIALSAESAGRILVETCKLSRPVNRMWVLASDRDRLAGLVGRLSNEVAEPV